MKTPVIKHLKKSGERWCYLPHAARRAAMRKPGWLDACLKAGQLSADKQWLLLDKDTHAKLRDQYRLAPPAPVAPGAVPKPGLGDALHKVLGPIGRAINWPCMAGDGTTNVRPGSPCDKRIQQLNKLWKPANPSS